MRRMPASWRMAMPIGLVLLAGCLNLAPKPDPTRFFVLSPVADSAQFPPVKLPVGATIGLREVEIPGYLDKSQLVTRVGPQEVKLIETARWGEPLGPMVTRVLASDLAAAAGLDEVVLHPWTRRRTPSFALRIVLQRFEVDGPQVVLEATWQAHDSAGARVIEPRSATVFEPAASADPEVIVDAMNRALARLGRDIVGAIKR